MRRIPLKTAKLPQTPTRDFPKTLIDTSIPNEAQAVAAANSTNAWLPC